MDNVSRVTKYLDSKIAIKENEDHGEGKMILSQLEKIHHQTAEIMQMVKPEDNFEGWIQNKIDLAEDYIQTVHDRLTYKAKENGPETEEEGY